MNAEHALHLLKVMHKPQLRIIPVKKTLGVNRFSRTLVTGSASAYEMKKIVSAML